MSTHKKARASKRSIKDDYTFEACSASKRRRKQCPSREACDERDGPAPPRRVVRRKNAAERFEQYQEEYEARGKASGQRAGEAERHGDARPHLRDVLQKRRSDGEPKPVRAPRRRRYNPADLCLHCRRATAPLPRLPPLAARRAPPRRRVAPRRRLPRRAHARKNVLTIYSKHFDGSNSTVYSLDSVPLEREREREREEDGEAGSEARKVKERVSKESCVSRAASAEKNGSRFTMASYHSFGSMGQPPTV